MMVTKFDIHKYIGKIYKYYPFRDSRRENFFNVNIIKDITYNNGWYTIIREIIHQSGERDYTEGKLRIDDLMKFLRGNKKKKYITKEEFEEFKMELDTKKFGL